MKTKSHFYLTLLFVGTTIVSYAQAPYVTIVKENGLVTYSVDSASAEAHIFTLYGDGTFACLSSPKHQFSTSDVGYPSIVYIVEPYEPIFPESIVSIPTGSISVEGPIEFENPEIAMDGEIDIMTSWATASGHENIFIIAFKNESSDIPVNGSVDLHYSNEEITVDELEVKVYNDWVHTQVVNDLEIDGYNEKISWKFDDLAYNETRYIYVYAAVEFGIENGVNLRAVYHAKGKKNENSETQNSKFPLSLSPHDPNFKTVNKTCLEGDAPAQTLEYTIGFFNDGEAVAEHVYLTDELSPLLNPGTVTVLDAEYDYEVTITGSQLEIDFLDINLPGTNQTDPKTYSYDEAFTYVTFSICTQEYLSYVTCIDNEASIVFHGQPEFITQPATVCVGQGCTESEYCTMSSPMYQLAPSSTHTNALTISVSPNPMNEEVNIQIASNTTISGETSIEIVDYTGKVVKRLWQENNEFTTFQKQFAIGDLPHGLYFLVLKTEDGVYTEKLLKQ